MKNYHTDSVITTEECKPSKEPPKDYQDPEPPLDLQNFLEIPGQSDVRTSLTHMLQAASHINSQLQDISSFMQTAKHRVSQLRKTLRVLHRGNMDLHMKIQNLQNNWPAQVQREKEEELQELLVPLAGECPEGQAKKLVASQMPATEPSPDRARPVVIDIAEDQQSLDDVRSSHCEKPALKSWRAWAFKSLTANILQLPKILRNVVDTILDDYFALHNQDEDELVEVVVLP